MDFGAGRDYGNGMMFTRTEAIDFAIDQGLKGVNFVHRWDGKMQVYWQGGWTSCLGDGDKPSAEPTEGRLAQVLAGRGDGWFVSARTDGEWFWYLDAETRVPHEERVTA